MTSRLKHQKAACNFIEWAAVLLNYLKSKDLPFKKGMPVIPSEMLVKDIPEEVLMLPYSKRSLADKPFECILCSFECDKYLYYHIRALITAIIRGNKALDKEITHYRKFYAVAGFDLTITPGMDQCEQDMLFFLNWLFNAVLAVNGVRIVCNFRIANERQAEWLGRLPKRLCYALGRIGEDTSVPYLDEYLTRMRILLARPSKLLLYGHRKNKKLAILDEFGVTYKCFDDHRYSRLAAKKEVM